VSTYKLSIDKRQVRVGAFHLCLEAIVLSALPAGIESEHLISTLKVVVVALS
jgi:hypothetical protein